MYALTSKTDIVFFVLNVASAAAAVKSAYYTQDIETSSYLQACFADFPCDFAALVADCRRK